ncbi:MAG: nicotinate-nicotinamide nucleotide adenylyltransferase [Treponema sp.]|nr:nicotinate-nicotinamide nucleotide adenylyltransferase [Treponema sp.]
MKIAMFGGSFNPLHIGHAMAAEAVINERGYDRVLFVPTCVPPHKEIAGSLNVSAQDRLNMVQAFCDSVNASGAGSFGGSRSESAAGGHFICEPCEFERGGISYTIDTVRTLYKKYEGAFEGKIGLIMGEEIGAEFYKWKNAGELIKLCDLIIVPRLPGALGVKKEAGADEKTSAAGAPVPKSDNSEGAVVSGKIDGIYKNRPAHSYKGDFNSKFDREKLLEAGFPCTVLSEPVIALSSTEIRSRIAAKKSWRYLVPPAVFDYIESNGLYRKN